MRLARRLSGFTLTQIVGLIAPLLALPILARSAGPTGWVSIAVAQAIGGIAAVVVMFGWWTAGPGAYLSTPDRSQRAQVYAMSVFSRLAVAVIAVPLATMITLAMTSPEWRTMSVLSTIAAAAAGLSPAWLFIAEARPDRLLLYEALPKVGATVAAMLIILSGGPLISYPILILLTHVLACGLSLHRWAPAARRPQSSPGDVWTELRAQMPVAAASVLGSAYSSAVVPIASSMAPISQVAPFATGDRLYRPSLFAISSLGNTLQAWVLEAKDIERHKFAIRAHVVLGLVGLALHSVVLPWATGLLFGPEFAIERSTATLFGVAFFSISVTTPLIRNIILPFGSRARPLVATGSAAVVGVSLMFALYPFLGVDGVAVGMAAGELVNLIICAFAVRRIFAGIDQGNHKYAKR